MVALRSSGKALAWAFSNRWDGYNDRGDHDQAIADCNQAITLDPKLTPPYNNLGNAYYDKGDLNRSVDDLRRALKLDFSYSE